MKADGRAVMRSMASGLLAIAGLAATSAEAADVGPPPVPLAEPALSIGDPAPALSVSGWVTRRDASEDAVAAFEPGEVYVVEFWATWCPPCVANIPHLGELADEFDGRVRVVSVSSEARDTVERFLDGGTGGASSDDDGFDFGTDEAAKDVEEAEAADPTYRELASRYDVAVDRDGLTNDAYMAASMSRGIPNAFVVGRDGLVEWVGHPARLDAVLAAVVAGTWDRAAFAEEFRAEKLDAIVEATFEQLRSDGRDDDAVALADWQVASAEGEDRLDAILKKVNLLLQLERGDEAVATTETLVADAGDDAAAAWRAGAIRMQVLMQLDRFGSAIAAAGSLSEDVAEFQSVPMMQNFIRYRLWADLLRSRLAAANLRESARADAGKDVAAALDAIAALEGLPTQFFVQAAQTLDRGWDETFDGADLVTAAAKRLRAAIPDDDASSLEAFDEAAARAIAP